jgi:chromosomal replication initiator protein
MKAIDRVIQAASVYYGTQRILSDDRHKTVALARAVAMYICRAFVRPGPSYPEIGRAFGKDHTTVMKAVQSIEERRQVDPSIDVAIKEIRQLMGRQIISQMERPCSENFPRWCS